MDAIVFLDSSVLIEYFRKKDKQKTFLFNISKTYNKMAISATTKHEIYVGSDLFQNSFWDEFLENVKVCAFDELAVTYSINIYKALKSINKMIEFSDMSVAAVALANKSPLATINKKHFQNIEGLILITPDQY